MIYYDFSKFQPMYYKGTLRSTIHMSHRLRRKPPGLVPILVWSPWSRFLEQRGSGSFVPARGGHPGGRGGVGKHEGHESYLWVVSLRVGGDRRGAGAGSSERRRWRRHERAWKLVERDGTWRARASASREESILAVGWWKLWPRDGVRRRPEF